MTHDNEFSDLQNLMDEQAFISEVSDNMDNAVLTDGELAVYKDKKRLQASTNANMDTLMSMINRLVTITMKSKNVEFAVSPKGQELLENRKQIEHPYIDYKLIGRKPKGELKPRYREDRYNKEDDRYYEVYGQKFKAIVQFNIYATTHKEAEELMDQFEDMMITYTGYIKNSGVSEIYFMEQVTDTDMNILRQEIFIRNLRYYVEIEKLTVISRERIKEVEVILNQNTIEEV